MTEGERPPPPGDPQAAPATPLVAWEAPVTVAPATAASAATYGGGQPSFTVGALLSDTFARYGADLPRFLLVSLVASGLSWLTSFAAPLRSNPFEQPTGFVDVSGLLGLLSFVAGIVGSSTMLALAEGGPGIPFGRAFRRGIERSGWLFLTSLVMGAAFIALFLVALIPIGLFALISPVLIVVPMLALFAVFLWAGLRLMLALPANVADNRNSIEALKVSWHATRPTGVWGRLLGTSLLLGLLVAPAAFGTLLFVLPGIFSTMFSGGVPTLYLLVPAVVFTLLTPLSLLLAFSAYRRLVPPLQPSWTVLPTTPAAAAPPPSPTDPGAGPEAGIAPAAVRAALGGGAPATVAPAAVNPVAVSPGAGEPAVVDDAAVDDAAVDNAAVDDAVAHDAALQPSAATFRVPRMGTAAKALLALILVFDVAGLAAIPYGISELARITRDGIPGFPGFPGPGGPGDPLLNGAVAPGNIEFGRAANPGSCTLDAQSPFGDRGDRMAWLAMLQQAVVPTDEVFVRVTLDDTVLETTLQEPGTYDCLIGETPPAGLRAGMYLYEVIVNGIVVARGTLFVP